MSNEQCEMKYKSVLVVTYGRSGSTLLQGLLNAMDGCVVRGENYNFCYGLYASYVALKKTKSEFGKGEEVKSSTWPWYGAHLLSEEKFIEDARHLVMRQLNAEESTREVSIGFKEIRYLNSYLTFVTEGKAPKVHGYLDFLAKLFEKPAIIVLTREHQQVLSSAWWKEADPKKVGAQLQSFEKDIDSYRAGRSWIYKVDYSDIVSRSDNFKGLYEFLGVPYDDAAIEAVLSKKHSFITTDRSKPAAPAKVPVSAGGAIGKPDISVEPLVDIQEIVIDPLPQRLEANGIVALRGVMVVKAECTDIVKLIAVDAAGEHDVEWGQPSPLMAKKYPQNKRAENARFKVTGLKVSPVPVELAVQRSDGKMEKIAKVTFKSA